MSDACPSCSVCGAPSAERPALAMAEQVDVRSLRADAIRRARDRGGAAAPLGRAELPSCGRRIMRFEANYPASRSFKTV